MKAFLITLLLGGSTWSALSAQNVTGKTREDICFNFDWKFMAGDPQGAEAIGFNDTGWRSLDLPHDYQMEQPWDSLANRSRGFKSMGTGWYRKTFCVEPEWQGRRVLLDFEGIMLHGDVWVNGQKAGGTDYGYLGFETDITSMLRHDTLNVVAVRADTGAEGGSRWYTGGGIYRDVRLMLKNDVAIARHGICVRTPDITAERATVEVQVETDGIMGKEYDLTIRARILSPEGTEVASASAAAPKKSRQPSVEVRLPAMKVSGPQLWDCDTPHLYTAEVELVLNGQTIDRQTERFGIRTVEYSKDFGLKLNGKKVFLKGIACHHDLGALGAAAYETAISRMMDKIKEFGFNHIRTSHNPYSEAFMRIADEKGILIVDELYDKWSNTVAWSGRRPWTEMWYENLMEWVKRDRNHPSVILWSLGNELQFQEERCGFPTRDWGVTTYNIMKTLVKRYDPTRLTTVAMYPARAGGIVKHDPDFKVPENILPPELATVTEVSSFNYCWDDYQKYLESAPDMIVYQSEAVTNELAAPYFGMDYDRMVGLAYWGAIEYWGESTGWPKKGWNYSFFKHSLEPNPQAYLIKSVFRPEEPLVHISIKDDEGEQKLWNDIIVGQATFSDHWNRTTGTKYGVYTYTNAEEVELFLNGRSLGVRKNPEDVKHRNRIYWGDVAYEPGCLKAIARTAGNIVAEHAVETTGAPVRLVAEVENADWRADGMSLQYIKVYAVDSKGRKVATANNRISVSVEGAARLTALDNGNHVSDDLFNVSEKQLYQGFALIILRSDRQAGKVTVNIEADGLKGLKKTLKTE